MHGRTRACAGRAWVSAGRDGWTQPGLAIGTMMQETAALMEWIGAASAMNLDGGGSNAMVVNGIDVGHPSDNSPANPTQRAVATSIVLTGS
ncbi:phosphodiester glycosidase family protein [Paraburkholderia jirisanensis]